MPMPTFHPTQPTFPINPLIATPTLHSALLSLLCSPHLGVRAASQRSHNQNGRQQPGHGDGTQLPALSV